MRVRLFAAEACVARHQYEGGALRKVMAERDETRGAAMEAKQALVDLVKGRQKRAKQHVELANILGTQRLERQEIKEKSKNHTAMVDEAKNNADYNLEATERHEEKLKLFRQRVEQRQRGFRTDHEEMDLRARTIWASPSKRPTVADLEDEKIKLHANLKRLIDSTREAEARIVILSDQRQCQRRGSQHSKEEGASTEERPNRPPRGQQQQHPAPENNGPAERSRRGGRGRRRGGRRPPAGNSGLSSVAARTQSSRDTSPAVEGRGAISGGVALGSQVSAGVAGASAAGATRGLASPRGLLPVLPEAEPKVPTSGNVVDHQEKPIVGESGRSVSTHARIQQSSAPPEDLTLLCRRLVREPEESSYFVGGNTRGVRRGGNAPATSSSTPVARPPVAQSSVAQLPAAAAGVQPSSTPPGFEYMVVPAGGVSHGNLAANSAAAADGGDGGDGNDGLPRTLKGLLTRCDCVHHLKRLENAGVTARSVKTMTCAQLKQYGVEPEVRNIISSNTRDLYGGGGYLYFHRLLA